MGIINRNQPTPNQWAAKVTDELFVITDLFVFLYLLKMFPFGANSCPTANGSSTTIPLGLTDSTDWSLDWSPDERQGRKILKKVLRKGKRHSSEWETTFTSRLFVLSPDNYTQKINLKKHEKRKMVNSPFNYAELHLQGRTCRKKAAALVSLQTFYFFQVVKEVPPNCLHLQRITEVKWSADSYRLIY